MGKIERIFSPIPTSLTFSFCLFLFSPFPLDSDRTACVEIKAPVKLIRASGVSVEKAAKD